MTPALRIGTSCRVAADAAPLNHRNGGGERDRTDDLLLAKQALSQLSYTPDSGRHFCHLMVGQGGFEPPTSRLSSARSNQLSYKPGSEVSNQKSVIRQIAV